jgi:antitoxin PrlF
MIRTGKITSKGQTTVPREVREALLVKPGDSIVWSVEPDGKVMVRRTLPLDLDYTRALEESMSEWRSAEDEEAYGDL